LLEFGPHYSFKSTTIRYVTYVYLYLQ